MFLRLRKIASSKFIRNVAVVATGAAGAQLITVVFAPIITRLYGPEAFGMLGTYTAVLAVLTPIAALTYPVAIVLPKAERQAQALAKLSAILALFVSGITFLILFLAGDTIANFLNLQHVGPYFLLVPAAMLFSAYQQIYFQQLIRRKLYKVTAKVSVIHSFLVNLGKAGAALLAPVGGTLILITVTGYALHAVLLRTYKPREDKASDSVVYKGRETLELARQHKDFPLYRAPQVALNAMSQSLPILMLAAFFGPAAAGFYSVGKMTMGLPAALIGKAVGDVFYPRVTEATHRGENIYLLLKKATLLMAAVGAFPFGVIVALGPWLFSFVFGDEWLTAGEYARWLALWLYFGFMNRPSVAAIATLGIQHWFLGYELISVAVRAFSIFVGMAIYNSDVISVALFSSSGVVLNCLLIAYTLTKSRKVKRS